MARALTVGAYHKYTPNNNNVFFNVACDYNLKQLESYIRGGEDEEGYLLQYNSAKPSRHCLKYFHTSYDTSHI